MSDDLVARLRDYRIWNHAHHRYDAVPVVQEAATALTEARAEIERRDAFIKELSDALRSIRPLGGSELFVKRFDNYYADPVYCKAAIENRTVEYHNAMKAHVRNSKRADAAESALAEAVDVMRRIVEDRDETASEFCGKPTQIRNNSIEAARAFVQQHEGKK